MSTSSASPQDPTAKHGLPIDPMVLLPDVRSIDAANPQSAENPSTAEATHFGGLPSSHRSEPAKKTPSTKGRNGNTHPNEPSSSNSRSQPSSRSSSNADEISTGYDRYEEREEIGRGGCGIVLRAWDRQLLREVVIKRVLGQSEYSAEAQSRFLNEARITGQLEHPGIVPVHEIGRHPEDGRPFYVMKWLQGTTLSTALREYHAMQPGRRKDRRFRELLVRYHQVCQTLAYAHQQGVIHRDLKPANVMLGQFGETIVLDWGLAKKIHERHDELSANEETVQEVPTSQGPSSASDALHQTQQGTIMGTAAYMSPEQAQGELSNVGMHSDVFSLGILLYEIVSGDSPFRAPTTQEILKSVAQADYKSLRKLRPNTPRALSAIVDRALQRNSNERYPTAAELAVDIESYLAGDSVSAFPEPWWLRMDRVIGKHKAVFRSAFLALVAVSTVALLSVATIHRSREAERQAKQLAQHESAQKAKALESEQRAHHQSNLQLKAARNAVDTWLVDLSGDLQFYPGLASLRGELLTRAKDYYASLSKAPIESASIELEVAKAHLRMGDIQRLTGQREDAWLQYQIAHERLIKISQGKNEASEEAVVQLANALIGITLSMLDSSNAIEEDFSSIEHSIDLAREYAANARQTNPENREAANAEARANLVRAKLFAKALRGPEAIASLNEALNSAKLLARDHMGSREQSLLASILNDLHEAYRSQGDVEATIQIARNLIDFYSTLLSTKENRPDWFESRAIARQKLGNALIEHQDPENAIVEYEKSSSDYASAWSLMYDDAFFQENLAISQLNLGKALLEAGKSAEAIDEFREAIERCRDIIRKGGADNDRILRMCHAYLGLAKSLKQQQAASLNSKSSSRSLDDSQELQQVQSDLKVLLDHLSQQPTHCDLALELLKQFQLIAQTLPK